MTEMFPALTPYALCVTLLSLNLLVVWNGSGGARARSKTTPNREDVRTFGSGIALAEQDPDLVARWMRAHRNATATIVPFLFLGLVYVLLAAPATPAWWIFGIFTGARIVHSIMYISARQPWRTVSYALSQLALVGLIVSIARAVV